MMVAIAVLALFIGVRVAFFVPLHNEMIGMKDPAPIAAADSGCGPMAVKMPCFRHANPQGRATASVPVQSPAADTATIAARETRCAAQQVKFPCLQHSDWRS
jgi:hypothetical protein